jgi:hypothetical protein
MQASPTVTRVTTILFHDCVGGSATITRTLGSTEHEHLRTGYVESRYRRSARSVTTACGCGRHPATVTPAMTSATAAASRAPKTSK